MKNSVLFSMLTTLATSAVLAETHQHEAHVHGEARINLVVEGHEVLLELQTPAANLLGFEHAPQTNAEKQQLKTTQSLLSDPSTLLSITNNPCQLFNADIELPFSDHKDHHHEKHEDHHHKDHEHNDEEKSDYAEVHGEVHGEIHAEYTLRCQPDKAISQLTIPVFDHFPGMEKLQLMWIKSNQQGSATLTATNDQVVLPE